ncbi:hypothetical protein [Actinoplanes sp. NPDC049265]|uniref:hypothetical protein n=1 Tax=Actinoplanes sp. NPDC049265 TaxID=3363902 RepID=UPI00372166F1
MDPRRGLGEDGMGTRWRPSVRRLTIIGGALLVAVAATGAVLVAVHRPEPAAAPPSAVPGPAPAGGRPSAIAPASPGPVPPAPVPPVPEPTTRRPGPHAQVAGPAQRHPAPAGSSSSPPEQGDPPADDPVLIEGALQERDPRPSGVPEQVEFFFGGGPECFDPEATRPRIEMASKPLIPTEFLLCFLGFDQHRPLGVTITPPGGRPVSFTATDDFFFPRPIRPSDRAGGYRVAARQGDRQAEQVFTVTRPERPRLWLDRGHGQIDHSVDLNLYYAGYPANGTVDFDVYREDHFYSTFRVHADAMGGGHAVLRTGGDLPDACWGITGPGLGDGPHLNVFCTSEAGRD